MSVKVRPAGVQVVKIRPGVEGANSKGVSTSTTPPEMVPGFAIADLGSGLQITMLRSKTRAWYFAKQTLARIWYLIGDDPPQLTSTLATSFVGTPVVDVQSTSFSITYGDAVSPTSNFLTITGQFDTGTGTMVLNSQWRYEHPVLKVECVFRLNPYAFATKNKMVCFVPSILHRDTTVVGKSAEAGHGNYVLRPEGNDQDVHYSSLPFNYHYHLPTRSGLLVRWKDTTGRMKEIGFRGAGDATDIECRYYPPDNFEATTGSTTIGLELRPMVGTLYEFATNYRQIIEAESPVYLSRGKLKNILAPGGPVSQHVLNTNFIVWVNLVNSADGLTRAVAEIAKLISYFGKTPTVFLYGWHANLFAQNWPSWNPVKQRAIDFVNAVKTAGVKVYIYTIQHTWQPSIEWFTTSGTPPTGHVDGHGAPSGLVVRDPASNPYIEALPGEGSEGPSAEHYQPQFGNAGARAQTIAQWVAVLSSIGVDGFYLDAFLNRGAQDYSVALSASQRGVGSDHYMTGRNLLLSEERAAARVLVPEFALISEHFSDLSTHRIEMVSSQNYDILSGVFSFPVEQTIFSEYLNFFGFDSYGSFPPAGPEVIGNLVQDMIWNQSIHFHSGKFQMVVVGDVSRMYLASQPGDPGHAQWTLTIKRFTDFVRLLTLTLDELGVRKYYRGRRLLPLPGSYDEYLETTGITFVPTSSPIGINFTNDDGMSSVWEHDEGASSPIGILLTNHRNVNKSFTIRMDRARYPSMGGTRFLCSNVAGVRTLIKKVSGHFTHAVSMAPDSVRLFELLTTAP